MSTSIAADRPGAEPEYLDTAAVARLTSLSERTVRAYAQRTRNRLPCYRLPGRLRFLRADVERWMQQFRDDGGVAYRSEVSDIMARFDQRRGAR